MFSNSVFEVLTQKYASTSIRISAIKSQEIRVVHAVPNLTQHD